MAAPELLGRRVEDTHTRKAAVELEGLREALRLAGYRRQREEEERAERAERTERERVTERQTQRATATQRQTQRVEQTIARVLRPVRELRAERLAPMQRVAQDMVRSLRRWLDERLGVREGQAVTARERLAQTLPQRFDPPRQSRGMRI